MNRYEQNCFVGARIRIDGDVWLGNLIQGCQIEIDRPPVEFDGNVIQGPTAIRFVGEMAKALDFIAKLAASNPQMRIQLRDGLGLGDSGTAADPPAPH